MSKATSLLRQIERRIAARRRPGAVMVMYWHDEEVTDLSLIHISEPTRPY